MPIDDDKIDFHKLAEEAKTHAYDPRAKRCWPWSHEWTMWERDSTGREQSRRCLRCGKERIVTLTRTCVHIWKTYQKSEVWSEVGGKFPIGVAHMQQCAKCGDVRRRNLTNSY